MSPTCRPYATSRFRCPAYSSTLLCLEAFHPHVALDANTVLIEEQLTGIILPDIPSSNTQSSPSSKENTKTKTTDERDKPREPKKAPSTSSLITSQLASTSHFSTVVDGSTIVNEPQNTIPTTDSRPVETSRPISGKETWSLGSGEEMTQELHTADASWISDIYQTEVLLGVGAWADGTWSDCHFLGEFGASLEDQEA
jgi:hypothetical protein